MLPESYEDTSQDYPGFIKEIEENFYFSNLVTLHFFSKKSLN